MLARACPHIPLTGLQEHGLHADVVVFPPAETLSEGACCARLTMQVYKIAAALCNDASKDGEWRGPTAPYLTVPAATGELWPFPLAPLLRA